MITEEIKAKAAELRTKFTATGGSNFKLNEHTIKRVYDNGDSQYGKKLAIETNFGKFSALSKYPPREGQTIVALTYDKSSNGKVYNQMAFLPSGASKTNPMMSQLEARVSKLEQLVAGLAKAQETKAAGEMDAFWGGEKTDSEPIVSVDDFGDTPESVKSMEDAYAVTDDINPEDIPF